MERDSVRNRFEDKLYHPSIYFNVLCHEKGQQLTENFTKADSSSNQNRKILMK